MLVTKQFMLKYLEQVTQVYTTYTKVLTFLFKKTVS